MNTNTFVSADTYLSNPRAAAVYVAERHQDNRELATKFEWVTRLNGTHVQCRIYGHSILCELGGQLEFLPAGEFDPYYVKSMEQVMAFILARNW